MSVELETGEIAVRDLAATISLFTDLGLTVLGHDTVSGEWPETLSPFGGANALAFDQSRGTGDHRPLREVMGVPRVCGTSAEVRRTIKRRPQSKAIVIPGAESRGPLGTTRPARGRTSRTSARLRTARIALDVQRRPLPGPTTCRRQRRTPDASASWHDHGGATPDAPPPGSSTPAHLTSFAEAEDPTSAQIHESVYDVLSGRRRGEVDGCGSRFVRKSDDPSVDSHSRK